MVSAAVCSKAVILFLFINPFMPNGASHPYQLDQCLSILRVAFFHFYLNLNRTVCKQTVDTLIKRRLPLSHKKEARLIWVYCLLLLPLVGC